MAAALKMVAHFLHVPSNTKWSNVWYTDTVDDEINQLAAVEAWAKASHDGNVLIERIVGSPFPVSGGEFIVHTVNAVGTATTASGDPLPLFNTVRLDCSSGSGRPSPKFLRPPLTEGHVSGAGVDGSVRTTLETAAQDLHDALEALGATLVSSAGQNLDSFVCAVPVQMRQLHRKRRRTPAP